MNKYLSIFSILVLSLTTFNNCTSRTYNFLKQGEFADTTFFEEVDFQFIKRSETIEKALENYQFYKKSTNNDRVNTIKLFVPIIIESFQNVKLNQRQCLLMMTTQYSRIAVEDVISGWDSCTDSDLNAV